MKSFQFVILIIFYFSITACGDNEEDKNGNSNSTDSNTNTDEDIQTSDTNSISDTNSNDTLNDIDDIISCASGDLECFLPIGAECRSGQQCVGDHPICIGELVDNFAQTCRENNSNLNISCEGIKFLTSTQLEPRKCVNNVLYVSCFGNTFSGIDCSSGDGSCLEDSNFLFGAKCIGLMQGTGCVDNSLECADGLTCTGSEDSKTCQ